MRPPKDSASLKSHSRCDYSDSARPPQTVTEDCSPQQLIAWILFKHYTVHHLFEKFLDRKAAIPGEGKESEVVLQQPRTVRRKEDQSLGVRRVLQCLLYRRQEFGVLGVVE